MQGRRLNTAEVMREWDNRGFTSQVYTDPPGREWKDYVRDMDELIMVLDGKIEIEMKGQKRQLIQGEEVLVPAGTRHTVRNVGDKQARNLWGFERDIAQTD